MPWAGFLGGRAYLWGGVPLGPPPPVSSRGGGSEKRTLPARLSPRLCRASRLTTSRPTPRKRARTLTCFSTLTTRPIILTSSAASVSEGPLSPFSRAFRSPGHLPTIWSTLRGKGTVTGPRRAPLRPPTRTRGCQLKGGARSAPTEGGYLSGAGRFALPDGGAWPPL